MYCFYKHSLPLFKINIKNNKNMRTKTIFKGYRSRLIKERWGYDVYYQKFNQKLWGFITTNGIKKPMHYQIDKKNHFIECSLLNEKTIEIVVYDRRYYK
jgi:hypothetical protein